MILDSFCFAFSFCIAVSGFHWNMITISLALWISKKMSYHICFKMLRLLPNLPNRRELHQLIHFVLNVRWVRNTYVLNVTAALTAKIVFPKCILLARFLKNINWNIWIQRRPQLEMCVANAKVTAKNCCTIVSLVRCQFATNALVHNMVNMKPRNWSKLWVILIHFGYINHLMDHFFSFRMKKWIWTIRWSY